jgi:hypothetical protein
VIQQARVGCCPLCCPFTLTIHDRTESQLRQIAPSVKE